MRGHQRLIPFIVAAFLVAGCGGGGDEGGDAGGTVVPGPGAPTTAAPAPTPTTESPLAAKARAAVFQTGDFPPGFQPQREEPGQGLNIEGLWGELARCLGVENTAQRTGMASSPTFLRGLATQARATVEYTSDASAQAIAAALAGPRFQSCANDAFNADVKRSAPEGGVPGPVAVAPLAAPPVPSKISSFRITVTINLDELKVPLFQDFLVAFEKGAVVRMFFLNPGSEFPVDLRNTLVQKALSRV